MRIPCNSHLHTVALKAVLATVLAIWSVACSEEAGLRTAEKEDNVESWYVPRIATVNPTGRVISLREGETIALSLEVEPYQSLPEEQDWQRLPEPVLSARTTKQQWSRAVIAFPCVLRADGIYKMWYMGNADASRRATQSGLGYATSEDGVHWEEYPGNPILTSEQIPWARLLHTPFVVYDLNDRIYKMWFTGVTIERDDEGKVLEDVQRVGYGESPDGITWRLHPDPVTRSGRRPCVLKEGDGSYRMWVNARPEDGPNAGSIYTNIIEARSPDGLNWTEERTVIKPVGIYKGCVYPMVLRDRDGFMMWHSGHYKNREMGRTDITFARSQDGYDWSQTGVPALPVNRDKGAFDARYTTKPYVLKLPGRYVMYYSARDMDDTYIALDGSVGRDGAGIERHFGYAYLDAEEREDPTLLFMWSVDDNGTGETGRSMRYRGEGAGKHTVTCRVENANGADSYSWEIEVGG